VFIYIYIFFASFLFCCHLENPQVGGEKKDEPTKKEKAPTQVRIHFSIVHEEIKIHCPSFSCFSSLHENEKL